MTLVGSRDAAGRCASRATGACVVRTANAPVGDLAERLVPDAMGGKLAHNSQKRRDVLLVRAAVAGTPAQRVRVKARVLTDVANAGRRQVFGLPLVGLRSR